MQGLKSGAHRWPPWPLNCQGDCFIQRNGLEQFLDHHLSNKTNSILVTLSKAGKPIGKVLRVKIVFVPNLELKGNRQLPVS